MSALLGAMAKLYFYYASMNAGKSTTLLQPAFGRNRDTWLSKSVSMGSAASVLMVFRAAVGRGDIARSSPSTTCSMSTTSRYMLKFDSVSRSLQGPTSPSKDGQLVVNGQTIRCTAKTDPSGTRLGRCRRRPSIVESDGYLPRSGGRPGAHRRWRQEGRDVGSFEGRHPHVRHGRERQHLQGRGRSSPTPPAPPTVRPRLPRCSTTTGVSSAP